MKDIKDFPAMKLNCKSLMKVDLLLLLGLKMIHFRFLMKENFYLRQTSMNGHIKNIMHLITNKEKLVLDVISQRKQLLTIMK